MPSFLNKVFGYKKHDDKEAPRPSREPSDSTLLDGKYEAISPVVSPSAITFAEAQSSKDAEREAGFSLFKPKSRGVSQKPTQKRPEAVPQLTLHLPGPKENLGSRAFSVAFEADPDTQLVLDDAVIGAKRLSPLEALILIRACAQVITERGLETLGIMHPHWFSASPDVQRKLISLFIHSLTPQSRITTLSPTPTSPVTAFENELHYTRSPHDVAAVLRWGLRHLSLENDHFGKDSAEWAWYNAFFNAERDASYPLGGFSQLLLPQLPAPHIELLVSTLTLICSLASHAEINSISGSKLSKFLGLWLVSATRSEQSDDWDRFYARWERAGRILEHLFLARLREESLAQRLPTRLQELIKYYPYGKGSPATEQDLLPRPRFSTVQYDALFVRVQTLLTHNADQPKQHPIQLIVEALQLPTDNLSGNEHVELWNAIKTAASAADSESSALEGPQFTRIFADETIQLLSLIPADSSIPTSPILLASPILSPRRSSSSLANIISQVVSKPRTRNGSAAASPTSPITPIITDWAQFSMSGFGETPAAQPLSALLDQDDDIEITQPHISRKSSHKRGTSRTRRRRSEDIELSATPSTQQLAEPEPVIVETNLASVHIIQIDEAFIDFWSDAIVDPISAGFPTFVICSLKAIPSVEKPIHWLVIEQVYTREEPSPPPRIPSPESGARGRSPRPSFRSDVSGFRISNMFSSTRKRFSVFSKSATDLTPGKKSNVKSPKVGELGEILAEEEPSTPTAAQGSNRLEETAIATPAVVNGTTFKQSAPVEMAKHLSTADIPGSTDQVPTTAQAREIKKELEDEHPSIESVSIPRSPGDLSANHELIKPSEHLTSTSTVVEVVSPSTPTPANQFIDVVDRPLAVVALPSSGKIDISAIPQETPDPQAPIVLEIVETAAIATEAAAIGDKVSEAIKEETQAIVQAKQPEQSAAVELVEVPSVAVTGEISESVVLVETPAPDAVVEASEPVVLAVEPEPVEEEVVEPVVEETLVSVQAEEPSQEHVAEPEPDVVETPAVEAVEAVDIPAAQEVVIEAEAQPAFEAVTPAVGVVEAPQEAVQEVEVATPVPETVALVEETPGQETCGDANQLEPEPEVVASVEEVASALDQLVEETPEPVVEEPQVVVDEEPAPEPVAPVEELAPAPELPVEETPELVVEQPQVVIAEEPAPESVAPVEEVVPALEQLVEETPEPVVEEPQVVVDEEPAPEPVAPVEEPAPTPEQPAEETPEPVVEEPQVVVTEEPAPEPVAPVEEVVLAPELPVEESAPPAAAEPGVVVVEEQPSQDPVAQPAEEPSVELVAAEPEAIADETIVAQVPVEEEPSYEVAVEEPSSVEAAPAEVAPEVVAEPEPVADEAPEPVVEEAQAPVEEDASQDAQPTEEPSALDPEAVDDVPARIAPTAEEVVEEVIVVEEEAPLIPESSVPEPTVLVEETEVVVEESEPVEVAPAIVAESEPAAEEAPTEPAVEETWAPLEAEESAPTEVPSTGPVAEVSEEVVTVEAAAGPLPEASIEVVEGAAPEAVEDVAAPEPVVGVVEPTVAAESEPAEDETLEFIAEVAAPEPVVVAEPEPVEDSAPVPIAEEEVDASEPVIVAEPEPAEDKGPEPIAEEEPVPIVVEEDPSPEVVIDVNELAVTAELEPSEDKAPEPIAEEVATEDIAPLQPVVDASESVVAAEPELAEDKAPEPLVEDEEPPAETVEPLVEPAPLVEDDDEDVSAPASQQEVAAEVIAVEQAAEPEPDVVSPVVEAVEEPQEVVQEAEPASLVVETTVLVEEDDVSETAILAPEPELSNEQAPELVGAEMETLAEAQESSEEAFPAVPSQEPESTVVSEEVPLEQPVEVPEEPAVEPVSEHAEVQPEAVQPEPEAAPFVEDEDVEEPLVEDVAHAEPSMLEVDVPAPEPPALADDATLGEP